MLVVCFLSSVTSCFFFFFFFSSRRRHTRSLRDWSSDVCSSDLQTVRGGPHGAPVTQSPPRHTLSPQARPHAPQFASSDRKSTRLNSSHVEISYAVFCLKKKKRKNKKTQWRTAHRTGDSDTQSDA